jgi:bifunctional non-homologous end joining protein LigD
MTARQTRADALETYRAKRQFDRTPELRGRIGAKTGWLYAIQKHAARRLHYDLRLELDGVLKSWAITKGPSTDPADKRLAVRTEDHPIDYATFEGRIPEGSYGAGTVLLWDRGKWEPIDDPHRGLAEGKLEFRLHGERLTGRWALVRFRIRHGLRGETWLLIKEKDEAADPGRDVTKAATTSVASGRDIDAISEAPDDVWGDPTDDPADDPPKRRARSAGALPTFAEPALATLVDDLPEGPDWLFEVKFDGYRALTAASGETIAIYSRNGNDWTDRFPTIARAIRALDLDRALLDGEIVAIDDNGRPDFSALQQALSEHRDGLTYFVFDLLKLAGKDLRSETLAARKKQLGDLLAGVSRNGPLAYTDHVEGDGREMLRTLCAMSFEGVIAKGANAPYRPGRSLSWLKIKCHHEQEFVIIGWSPSPADRPFASILLAQHVDGRLRYAGRVGSGFSDRTLSDLAKRFANLERPDAPVDDRLPRGLTRGVHWVEPKLAAEVAFAEFTGDGILRQGRFVGLREDKPSQPFKRR